jgi:predicted DNA-binding transcriptional regulator AlpA
MTFVDSVGHRVPASCFFWSSVQKFITTRQSAIGGTSWFFFGDRIMDTAVAVRGEFLTVDEVADRLRVGKRTVWRWVARGSMPQPLRFSTICVRWRIADIDRFIEEVARQREQPRSA